MSRAPRLSHGLPAKTSVLAARPPRAPPQCSQAPLLTARPLAGAALPLSDLGCHLTHDKEPAVDTRSPGHTTEPAPVQPRTSAPDATDGRDGVAGGRGAPEWQTRGRRGLSDPSGRRPRPPGTCSAAPSLPSRKEECGCFLKEKKTLLPLNLRHFPRARKRAWGAGAPRSLSDAPRRAPALRPEHAHTPPSCVRLGRTRSSKLARPRQVSGPVRLRPKAASKSRPAPSPRRPLPAPTAPKPPLPRSPGEVSVLACISLLSHGPQNASPRVDGVPQAPRPPPPGREAARRLPAEERGVFGRPNARFLQDVSPLS